MTIGEQRVRTQFNPAQDSVVDQIKQKPKQRRVTTELLIIQEDLRIHL